MPTDNKPSYLAKLLTMLVKKEGGQIRIPASDLMTDDVGSGIQVHFDYQSKELVLTHVPSGATFHRIEESQTWLAQALPQAPKMEKNPLSQEELIAKIWTASAGTPTVMEERLPQGNKVVTLTSETMAEAEQDRRKQAALREIESYQSPQPRSRPSRPLTTFSK